MKAMKAITPSERRALRAKAHHLEPVVMIGHAGLTPSVIHEIDVNLQAHELIKVRVLSDEREQREGLLSQICEQTGAEPVQHIGKLFVLYRERPADLPEPLPAVKRPVKRNSVKSRRQEDMIAARRRPRPTGSPTAKTAQRRPKPDAG